MPSTLNQALASAHRQRPTGPKQPRLLIAGAGGVLGGEVTRRLIGCGRFSQVQVLLHEPMQVALRHVTPVIVPAHLQHPPTAGTQDAPGWPSTQADVAVVMFEPPRGFYQRERSFWTPDPTRLPALAAWLREAGVRDLLVLTPHQSGRLPQALQRGLAHVDEAATAALGFERVLLLRAASTLAQPGNPGLPHRVAAWMLGIFRDMVPTTQQPVRAVHLARVVDAALVRAPPGVHVLGPELLHAAQADPARVLDAYFGPAPSH